MNHIFCPACGYNLRGLTGDRCPECGDSIEGVRDPVSKIPWVHRKQLGWWRAYWRTVWLVMFKQRRFANEMARPVSYRDSQSFRWVTIALAYLAVLLGNLTVMVWPVPCPSQHDLIAAICSTLWMGASLHVGYILFLAAATGIPSYFFHPGSVSISQQNRAIALGYYSCGSLSLALLPSFFWSVAIQVELGNKWGDLFALLSVFTGLGLFTVWWLDLIHLMRRLLPQHPRRATAVALMAPTLWLALALVLVPGILLVVGSLVVVLRTLR